jgi:L-ascorbate metabolism protein UlaG (beta-lactamase superfamily)
MSLQFTVLASGSAGNATLLQVSGFSLLLDAGLGPRQLDSRLKHVGSSLAQIQAVLLTHTHSDHWRNTTLVHLARKGIPLFCHGDHQRELLGYASAFATLLENKLVRLFSADEVLLLGPGLRCRPIALRHDAGATFGFRFELDESPTCRRCSLAYAADLGTWDADLAQALADVDLLALEFNHDVDMQHASGRAPDLIARILGEEGHLSNAQAANLVQEILRRSPPGRLRHIVQLHLSRECNRPDLAAEAALSALMELGVSISLHTACQDAPLPTVVLGPSLPTTARAPAPARSQVAVARPRRAVASGPWLPGMESN